MKCKYCHKNVRSIAHFSREHHALLMRHRKKKTPSRTKSKSKKKYCSECGKPT